jgi:hypothetical protein
VPSAIRGYELVVFILFGIVVVAVVGCGRFYGGEFNVSTRFSCILINSMLD